MKISSNNSSETQTTEEELMTTTTITTRDTLTFCTCIEIKKNVYICMDGLLFDVSFLKAPTYKTQSTFRQFTLSRPNQRHQSQETDENLSLNVLSI